MTDPIQVFEQIQRAVRTLRKLPAVKVRSKFCNWPDFIRRFEDAYGTSPAQVRIVPTARQLTELDEVIDWLAWLSRFGSEYPLVVWARAEDYSWRKIAAMAGLAPNTCKERFREGVCAIAYRDQPASANGSA